MLLTTYVTRNGTNMPPRINYLSPPPPSLSVAAECCLSSASKITVTVLSLDLSPLNPAQFTIELPVAFTGQEGVVLQQLPAAAIIRHSGTLGRINSITR